MRDIIIQNLQPILSVLADLTGSGVTFRSQTSSETHMQLVGSSGPGPASATPNLNLRSPVRGTASRHDQSYPITSINTTSQPPAAALTDSEHGPRTSPPVEQHHLASHTNTVVDLWREYTLGVPHRAGAPPAPSIRQLDREFGPKWRAKDNCRKAYSRRRHIWEAVEQASENLDLSPEIVAEKVDRWRENHGYTLNRLNRVLAESRKSGPSNLRGSGLWGEKDVELFSVV